MVNRLFASLLLCSPLFLSGCQDLKTWYAREFRQGDVTSGIVRLSAQHLGMITREVGNKFKEPGITTKIMRSDDPREMGKGVVEKTIENVIVESPDEKIVFQDCMGVTAAWKGKIEIVKATQTIYGRLTNNPDNPVVPDPDRVKITIQVKPHYSQVRFSDKPEYLQFDDGEISFDVYPRLAQAQAGSLKGLRVIPTSDTRFEKVMMKNMTGTLRTKEVTMPFTITESNMLMQVGRGDNGDENILDGEIVAFGLRRKIPIDGNQLNPDYNRDEFIKTYSCNEDLSGVVEYKNVMMEERIAPAVAGLTALAMSRVAAKLADDYECGMSSVAFLRSTTLTGEAVGMGSSSGGLPAPCTIKFDEFKSEPDCFGVAYEVSGQAVVTSATKDMKGLVFLDETDFTDSINAYEEAIKNHDEDILTRRPEPVIPKSRQPAVVELTANFRELAVKEICVNTGSIYHDNHCNKRRGKDDPLSFKLHTGTASARLKPVMGKNIDESDDEQVYMCSVRSVPIAETEFVLDDVTLSLAKSGNQFQITASGAYEAINGKLGDHENELSGEMTISGVDVAFKADGKNFIPLIPDYDAKTFLDSFLSCSEGKFIVPEGDDDCSLAEREL